MHNIRRKIAFLLAGVMVAGMITATPFTKTVSVTAAVQEENVNLLPNGDFESVSDSWGGWAADGGEATFEQKDGALVCDIANVGTVAWSVQACCNSGFGLYEGGKYRLTFDINSTEARDLTYGIQMNGGDYRSYVSKQISVDSETQTVSVEFTMTSETDLAPALFFNMGTHGVDLAAHTVTIDNANLELIDGSDIKGSSNGIEENVNIIPNGTFDEVSDCWGSYTTDGGKATIEQKDGALVCDIASVGTLNYSVQASCGSGFMLYQNGKYRLSFDISSTVARELEYGIQLNGGDYHAYVSDHIAVNEETQRITIEFTMTDDTDRAPALFFNMGIYNDEDLAAHVVTIDNVDLQLTDGSDIKTTVEKQEENVNLIPSGDFEGDASNWGSYTTDGGKAVIGPKDGALICDIESVGTLNYSVQASCGSGFTLYQNGKYRLSFDISSTVARELEYGIQMNGGDYHAYISDKISVSEDVQTITIDFTMVEDTDKAPALFFNMGIYNDEDLAPHIVTIDNVDLQLVDGSDIVYEDDSEVENTININQVGYKTDARKVAVVRGENVGSTFKVIKVEDGSVVYEGQLSEAIYTEAAEETNYLADFSSVTEPGNYYVEIEGLGTSYEFEIGDEIFENLLQDSLRFFYLQRCGDALTEDLAGNFAHGDCHQELARIYGTEEYMDVSGGWHDAGDYGRYVVATAKAVADLMIAYQANPYAFTDSYNIPESGNGQSDMLDEIRGQLEWLMKMQNKENGGVYHKVTTANFPGNIAADEETGELIICPITTTATGDFAAIMGMGYEAFKDIDKDFAETCLAAGEKAYDYLADQPNTPVKNPEGIATGEYGDNNDSDERYWAAASLYKATGDSKYHDDFKAMVAEGVKTEYGWQTVGSYGNSIYLTSANQDEATAQAIQDSIIEQADSFVALAKTDGYEIANGLNYYWGSNMSTLNNASILVDAYNVTGNEEYLTYAKEHVNYVLGKNAKGMSYVTGYGDITPQNPHHRPSVVAGEAIKGALVGGPNKNLEDNYAKAYLSGKAPAKCYMDHVESYSTNEVDIYWNSTLVRALAEMKFVDNSDEISDASIKTNVATTIDGGSLKQTFNLTVDGDQSIDTSKIKIRYYFTEKDAEDLQFWCDHAAVNTTDAPWYTSFNSAVTSEFVKTYAGYYVEISLNEAITVAPNGIITVETRLNSNDWTSMEELLDGNVNIYYDDKLVK